MCFSVFFFFNDTATTEIYTLSLHDALPIFDISGKTAIVTGGSSGIGAMIARGFVENGVKTYISARKEGPLMAKAEELSEYGTCKIGRAHV